MHQTIHQWKEQKRAEFRKFSLFMAEAVEAGDASYKDIEKSIADFWLSQLPSLLTLLEEQIPEKKRGNDTKTPYDEGLLNGVNTQRDCFRELLSEAKQSFT